VNTRSGAECLCNRRDRIADRCGQFSSGTSIASLYRVYLIGAASAQERHGWRPRGFEKPAISPGASHGMTSARGARAVRAPRRPHRYSPVRRLPELRSALAQFIAFESWSVEVISFTGQPAGGPKSARNKAEQTVRPLRPATIRQATSTFACAFSRNKLYGRCCR